MTDQLHQQVYDTVAEHLLTQGRASSYDDVGWYRGLNNHKCAIGCLIPDDKYDPRMEGRGVQSLMHNFPGALPPVDSILLQHLQTAHDTVLADKGLRPWADRMLRIAADWQLSPAIVRTYLENNDDTP